MKITAIETLRIPLFPLGTVLFPGGLLPLKIFEQRYLDMAAACLKDDKPFGICLIAEGGARLNDEIVLDAGLLIGAGELIEPIKLTAGRKRHALVTLG